MTSDLVTRGANGLKSGLLSFRVSPRDEASMREYELVSWKMIHSMKIDRVTGRSPTNFDVSESWLSCSGLWLTWVCAMDSISAVVLETIGLTLKFDLDRCFSSWKQLDTVLSAKMTRGSVETPTTRRIPPYPRVYLVSLGLRAYRSEQNTAGAVV